MCRRTEAAIKNNNNDRNVFFKIVSTVKIAPVPPVAGLVHIASGGVTPSPRLRMHRAPSYRLHLYLPSDAKTKYAVGRALARQTSLLRSTLLGGLKPDLQGARQKRPTLKSILSCLLLTLFSLSATAATLPEDRLDIMYHSYKGGGATIDGPSILVRKKFADKVSVRANYYADFVSSASIDVIATASPYTQERTEFSGGIDYLHNKTTMGLGFTSSSENDYDAQTVGFNISQDFFGDLSTLAMGYSVGTDTVRRRDDEVFEDTVDRQQFNVTLTQIITQ